MLGAARAHLVEGAHEDVHAVGDGQGQNDDGRDGGRRIHLHSQPGAEPDGGRHRQADDEQRRDGAGDGTQQQEHEGDDEAVHHRNQRPQLQLGQPHLGVAQDREAGKRHGQVRVCGAQVRHHLLGAGNGSREMFGVIGAGKLKRDQHAGGVGIGRDQAVEQRRLVERHRFDLGQLNIA